MKRHENQKRCSRMEFKCKIYDLIKELDKSMKSTCSQPQMNNERSGGAEADRNIRDRERKGSECCCRPGCCQESLKFRPPNLAMMTGAHEKSTPKEELPERRDLMGHLPWHKEDHNNGCWHGQDEDRKGAKAQRLPSALNAFPMTPEEMQQMGCFIAKAV